MFLFGGVVATHFLSLFETDLSIVCLLTYWRCGPCARLCYPMSDVALAYLCRTITAHGDDGDADYDDDDDDDDDEEKNWD